MKTMLTAILATLCLLTASSAPMLAQEYSPTPVILSKEKIRFGGKVYYSHVVQDRQTLFSISKAYGVTLPEIFEANRSLNLEKEGLKKNQILLIPVKEISGKDLPIKTESKEVVSSSVPGEKQELQNEDYFFHRVKWYEDLEFIARKHNVSPESILNINGLTSRKVKSRQMLKIPRHPEKWENLKATAPEEKDEAIAQVRDATDSTRFSDIFDNIFLKEGRYDVSASLLLPFNTRGKTSDLAIDFYTGALMAARDLGNEGTNVDLSVFDAGGGNMPVTKERFSRSDFTIGPVSNDDLLRAVNVSQGNSWIVSPLDPKAEALADSIPNLIQAPPSTNIQIGDVVNWIASDIRRDDKVILITQKGVNETDYASAVTNAMGRADFSYSTASYSILEGRNSMQTISNLMSKSGTNRIITASDSEAFLIEVVRNLFLLAHNGYDIILYSTSKIRTFDTIDIEQLHDVNLHVSVSYFIDYDSRAVRNFVMEYRALFNADPNQFAFQGYDLMKGMSTLRAKYGRNWDRALVKTRINGLQSDLDFFRTSRGGYQNKAVRRIIYAPDYSIRLVQ